MDGEVRHLVGLLLGTEDDWPRAFEHLVAGLGPVLDGTGRRHLAGGPRQPRAAGRPPRTIGMWSSSSPSPMKWTTRCWLIGMRYARPSSSSPAATSHSNIWAS